MKTKHPYIYFFKPQTRSAYYLVRFRNNKGEYVQATFANSKNPKEALHRAIEWCDNNIPENRTLNTRLLQKNPQKNKSTDLPAGITLTYYIAKRKRKSYRYNLFYVTTGMDEKGKVICRRIYITKDRPYFKALKLAKSIRRELAEKHNKTFTEK